MPITRVGRPAPRSPGGSPQAVPPRVRLGLCQFPHPRKRRRGPSPGHDEVLEADEEAVVPVEGERGVEVEREVEPDECEGAEGAGEARARQEPTTEVGTARATEKAPSESR